MIYLCMEVFQTEKNSFEVLESAEQLPDVVLLDLVMPEMNGIEVTEKLKKNIRLLKY